MQRSIEQQLNRVNPSGFKVNRMDSVRPLIMLLCESGNWKLLSGVDDVLTVLMPTRNGLLLQASVSSM